MSNQTSAPTIVCHNLTPEEAEKVGRLDEALTEMFSTLGHSVRICRSSGVGTHRLLCFLTTDERNLGSVRAADLLEAPDHLAAGLVSPWVR